MPRGIASSRIPLRTSISFQFWRISDGNFRFLSLRAICGLCSFLCRCLHWYIRREGDAFWRRARLKPTERMPQNSAWLSIVVKDRKSWGWNKAYTKEVYFRFLLVHWNMRMLRIIEIIRHSGRTCQRSGKCGRSLLKNQASHWTFSRIVSFSLTFSNGY